MRRTEAFEQFIAPARAYPELWRLLVGCAIAVAVYAGGLLLAFALLGVLAAWVGGIALDESALETAPGTLALLATFIFMALAAIAAALAHRRGLRSLLGPSGVAQDTFKAISICLAFYGLVGGVSLLLLPDKATPNLDLTQWLSFLPLALPLLFIQTTSEELLFRGYLMQQLAARFKSAVIWMGLPTILFALGHTNMTLDPLLTTLIVLATGLFGLVAADMTRITGNLGVAMGVHFINNFFALLLVAVPGQLSGLSLYHSPYTMDQTDKLAPLLVADLVVVMVLWLILRRVFARG